ncbi:MAG: Hpt domain-containing protein [Gammaproteobacteria bacterium]|jgi:chemosensory pili system protein ChpA (sensor histidine kinase/response regulator)
MSIAQQELDYTTLKWVKDEIQESLKQTHQALEAYVENPDDSTQIRFCATYLHQIYGTLQMVEIYGGALLAEEMELLTNAISQGKVSRKEDAYDVLMRAILQLPAYLEHLENGQQDMPVILLPLLNDLRTARGEHLLSENAFFSPDLSVTPPAEARKKTDKEPADVQQYAKKLRPVYQAALVRWYRDMNPPEALKKLSIVLRELLNSAQTESATRLWWVASGIMEGLQDKGLETSNSIKQLMGHQIDRQIKRVVDSGERILDDDPPVELLKNLLYYVATSTSQGEKTRQIKAAFNLEHLLPGSVDVNEAFAQLRGSNADLMQSVSSVIKEDLLNVKDQLDIYVRTTDKPVTDLEPLAGHLNRISDTLAMLGLGDLHKIIQDQKTGVDEIIQAGARPSDVSLMEIASALLYVESSLEGVESHTSSKVLSSDEQKNDSLLPPSEQRQLNNLVIGEAASLVAKVKEAFNVYAMDTSNRDAINAAPDQLDQVRGVLAILDLEKAAKLLNAAIDYIRNQLLREDIEPNRKALDLLADVITSIEYFLEAVAENRWQPESILQVAETSAQELGYTPETITELDNSRTEPGISDQALEDIAAEDTTSVTLEVVESDVADEQGAQSAMPAEPEAPSVANEPAGSGSQMAANGALAAAAPAGKPLPEDDIDEEILEIFLEEADEVVGTMKENLSAWKQNNENSDSLTVLRRSYHTIKGSGRLAGAKAVGEFAWAIENMLNRVIDGRLEIRPEVFEVLEKAESTLEAFILHLKGERDTQPNAQAIVDLADALANGTNIGAAAPKPDLIDELLSDITAPSPSSEHEEDQSSEDESTALSMEYGESTLELEETTDNTEELSEAEPVEVIASQDNSEQSPAADNQSSLEATVVDIFRKESDTHLAVIDDYLANYSDDNLHYVTEPLMRALHTLHGSANMASVENIAELSEHLDRYFATLYDSRQVVNSDIVDVLTQGIDLIKTMLQNMEDSSIGAVDSAELIQRIKQLHDDAKDSESYRPDSLSIIPGFDPEISDGLEEVVETLSNDGPDGLGETVESFESTSDGLDDVVDTVDDGAEDFADWMVSQPGSEQKNQQPDEEETIELSTDDSDGLEDVIELSSEETFRVDGDGYGDTGGDNDGVNANESYDIEEIELSAPADTEYETPAAITQSADDQEADDELLAIFLDEADELLHNCEALIQGWSTDPGDHSIMEELQRSLHTLKGGARMADQSAIANLSHRVESLLETVTDGSIASSPRLPKTVQQCQDWLTQALEDIRSGEQTLQEPTELMDLVQSFIDGQEPEEDQASEEQPVETSPAATADEQELEDALPLEDDENAGDDISEEIVLETIEPVQDEELVSEQEDDDADLRDIFLEEAIDIQERNDHIIHRWLNDQQDLDAIAELQRNLHTLKGGARMAGISSIADVAHVMETLLEQIAEQRLAVTDELPNLIQQSHDWIVDAINSVRHHTEVTASTELMGAIKDYISQPTPAPPPVTETEPPAAEFEIQENQHTLDSGGDDQPSFDQAEAAEEYDEELVEIFLEEAEEIQENTDRILHDWSQDIDNRDLIAELQRALHTLKGGARMAGISAIGDLSHAIESLMEAVTAGSLEPTREFPKVVHNCHDWLSSAIERVKQHQPLEPATLLSKQLENLLAGNSAMEGLKEERPTEKPRARPSAPAREAKRKPVAKPAPAAKPEPEPAPGNLIDLPSFSKSDDKDASVLPEGEQQPKPRTTEEQIRVKADHIDNMVNHVSEINIYNARIGQQLGQWHFNLKELEQTIGRFREQLRNFEMETEQQIMYRHADVSAANVGSGGSSNTGSNDVSFDPLELDRFSYMQQLSRSMVESFDDLTSIQNLLESLSGDTDVLLLQQSRINNDLQEELMRTRLTPFSSVVARLRRVVRQTCQETGKEAELQINGADGEMDRTQLNRIVPALEHILRNAIDHGLESPAQRKKAKKPETGTIAIDFSREGSEVVLKISDDGAGINVEAIRKKAVERGIIEKNSKVEDDEVLDFILQSGFSTAEQITQISGRGVGMDVVHTEIKQLNGSLHIGTEQGKGSTFTVRLPLTVLINQALMVNVDEAVYAIPLSNIEHVIRLTADELNTLIAGKEEHYQYAGFQYQHLNIGYVLHGSAPVQVTDKGKYPVLLARSGDHRVALQVDQLIGRQEIVIKSVGPQLSSINSISGATILPDGEVALILDLATLIRTSHALQKTDEAGKMREVPAKVEKEKPVTVLIVDDSITVRKVTQRLLNRHNYESLTAKDGMDALTVMLEQIPDIILLDVEMPRMDGYELATAVRSDPRLKHIPIIMITSRTGDKHRDRALSIGVNMYMGKPYQEHELLDNIQSLIHDQ